MIAHRLSPTFHETFALSLPSVGQVLELACEDGESLSVAKIRSRTGLGTGYVDVMPRYARGCGLIEFGTYLPTPFGRAVRRNDPGLVRPSTLWLMHYHMASPHGPGPGCWSHLATTRLAFGREIWISEVVTTLTDFLAQGRPGGLAAKTVRSTATVFLGSYIRSDGLGRLGLLRTAEAKGTVDRAYLVSGPQQPPLAAMAYALADYWEATYGDQTTVSLSDLASDSGFARIMWMDSVGFDRALDALRKVGVIDMYRIAPPYQVVRLWSTKSELLDNLYP
jgi:hypothetical protein